MMFGIAVYLGFPWFYQSFSKFSGSGKRCKAISYRKPYCKGSWRNVIETWMFSLNRTVFIVVWTSYSTNLEYYFPLTAPRISSPYVNGKCGFGWGKGLKTMPKTVHFKRKEELRLCIILVCLFLRWFSSLYLNQNHTFNWRTDFIFQELLEENSTASSWNLKFIRQRKVFVWEKTSPFWWNSFRSIYCRASYSNSLNAIFQQGNFRETTRKIRIFKRESKFWGPLFFGMCLVSSNQPSIWF